MKSLNANKSSSVVAVVQSISGEEKKLTLPVTVIDNPNIFSLESQLGQVEGVEGFAINATVAILADSSAYKLGLRTGDEIVAINSEMEFSSSTTRIFSIARPLYQRPGAAQHDPAGD